MRPLDELARLWNDTRSRMPQGAWSWPLVAAAAGAMIALIGTGSSERPAEANSNVAATPAVSPAGCQDQTWPFLSDDCLRREATAGKSVRVLQYEPALAAAAIGATQWTTKAPPSSRQPPSRHKQATHDSGSTVTVHSGRRGRNAARERTYAVPADAFSAYGSARR